MKYKVWFLTYISYGGLHLLRTAFPFVQYDISKYYETD